MEGMQNVHEKNVIESVLNIFRSEVNFSPMHPETKARYTIVLNILEERLATCTGDNLNLCIVLAEINSLLSLAICDVRLALHGGNHGQTALLNFIANAKKF